MAGGMASAFPFQLFFYDCNDVWHALKAVHAISHPQLSVSPSLTLNHCTVLCEKGEKKQCNLPLLAHAAESAILSFSLFITLIGPHVGVCHSAVTYCSV